LNEVVVKFPTLHPGQIAAYFLKDAQGNPARFRAIRCGRRWGKTAYAQTLAGNAAIKGELVGYFTPAYKYQSEVYNELIDVLKPVILSSSKTDGVIRTKTGGRIDFWSLENESAGRSRKYHQAIIDEAAFTKPNMMDIWNRSIQPTLLDYMGSATALSNTNGVDQDNFFWRICNEPEHGFTEFHAPTSSNPYMPKAELERLQRERPPLVWQQEYLAEFVDWAGVQFFALANLLVNDHPVKYPELCSGVFAVIDTATKVGKDHDGTAVVYCALSHFEGHHPLIILDYDIKQIEGAVLEEWLPSVFEHCEYLAGECHAQMGSLGVWIEDKNSGSILLQQGQRRGWNTNKIDSKLTQLGKTERAISVSGYVYRNQVKLSKFAYEKSVKYKGAVRNHLLNQVLMFTIGIKDQHEDDLLDAFTYAIAIALGDSGGF